MNYRYELFAIAEPVAFYFRGANYNECLHARSKSSPVVESCVNSMLH